MKFYITKPIHDKYGRIKLNEKFNSLDDFLNHCIVWVKEPVFEKPFICIFEGTLCIRGWNSDYGYVGKLEYFPEGEVKNELKKLVLNSIDDSFNEKINEKYYRWVGHIGTILTLSDTSGNFNLHLTKPDVSSIKSRGIDRAEIFLNKPILKRSEDNIKDKKFHGKASIEGKYFRKEKHFLLDFFWYDIVHSFDVDYDNFYKEINYTNSKIGQNRSEFLKEYYLNIQLDK